MKLLLILTLIVTTPAALAGLQGRLDDHFNIHWHTAAKIGVSLLFLLAGSAHFVGTQDMIRMLPPSVPRRVEIIYVSGVLEFLGAAGIWIPRLEQITGACLVALIVAVFPANLYTALNHIPIAGHQDGLLYLLVRVPFEIFLIVWIYRATRQQWASRVIGGSGGSRRADAIARQAKRRTSAPS